VESETRAAVARSFLREAEDLVQRGRPEEASSLLADRPGAAAQVLLARLAIRGGDLAASTRHYREALARDDGNLAALRALAAAALNSGESEEANGYLDRWATIDPGDPELEDQLEQCRLLAESVVEPDRPLPVSEELEELLTRPQIELKRPLEILEGELLPAPALADPDLWDLGDDLDAERSNQEE